MRNLAFYLLTTMLLALPMSASAAPEPQDPKKQTPWGLYLDSREAYEMKMAQDDQVLFVDVREPIEIMFTGFTDVVDVNIPFLIANRSKWHPSKPNFAMEKNPNFEPAIARALQVRGLSKETPVILMCRSGGTRGAPSALALEGKGYSRVYVVVDGFEGGSIKEGPRKNWRLQDGWKNAGLPWSYKLNQEKMYFVK
ncbi:rhodanese-like domain-containing protein [Denitrobaculum tricleocarpae]|nr:rhodanese-like domain-containing protein [Denitrobaculum tricleocarpae]